ncbi:DUF5063 domain-containing protein [Niallia sp. XMNu-256]|uniref:DUF5063 domain-containing protein n=1 Tax=Niallia sp. XMNu-256 TaxID=3082444 RepID=UPI0030D1E24E
MKNKEVGHFFLAALNYFQIVEGLNSNKGKNDLNNLLVSLLDLYSKALYLPDVEPEKDVVSDIKLSVPQILFDEYDHYWQVFNPYHLDDPVGASLSDDILDIYKDVKKGILFYTREINLRNFEIDWGNHAVNAIRALHSAK